MGKDVNKLVNLTTKKPIRISADPDHVIFIFYLENSRKITSTNYKTKIKFIVLQISSFAFSINKLIYLKSYCIFQNKKTMS
jgi:hypothetical protein